MRRSIEPKTDTSVRKNVFVAGVVAILLLITILSALYIYDDSDRHWTEAPTWSKGDTWIFNEIFDDSVTNASLSCTVKDVITFKDQTFYELSGMSGLFFGGSYVSANSLNAIELVDHESGMFRSVDRTFDFPLYHGKKWDFIKDYDYFSCKAEFVHDVDTGDELSDAFLITRTKNNCTSSYFYYSQEASFIFKTTEVNKYFGDLQLESCYNKPLERMTESTLLDNKFHSRLETWEIELDPMYSAGTERYAKYRISYDLNGVEHSGWCNEYQKSFLDWIVDNTDMNDTIMCRPGWGHIIRGYTGRDVVIDGPSKSTWNSVPEPWCITSWSSDDDLMAVSEAFLKTPAEAEAIMREYSADLILIDYSMFPFSARNMGIFPALVRYANLDLDDYLVLRSVVQEYDENGHEMGSPLTIDPTTAQEMLKTNTESAYDDWSMRRFDIVYYTMEYNDAFFDSMFYRMYIGYSARDVGGYDQQVIPGITNSPYFGPEMHGWNLTRFQMIYETLYYSEKSQENASFPDFDAMNSLDAWEEYYDHGGSLNSGIGQGIFMFRHTEGATVEGVVTDYDGFPVPGARVTVRDDFGVPHDSCITGVEGDYALVAPFGSNVSVVVSRGGFAAGNDGMKGRADMTEVIILNETSISITLAQAMHQGDPSTWHIRLDPIINATSRR